MWTDYAADTQFAAYALPVVPTETIMTINRAGEAGRTSEHGGSSASGSELTRNTEFERVDAMAYGDGGADSIGPLFIRDLARLLGLPDDAELDVITAAVRGVVQQGPISPQPDDAEPRRLVRTKDVQDSTLCMCGHAHCDHMQAHALPGGHIVNHAKCGRCACPGFSYVDWDGIDWNGSPASEAGSHAHTETGALRQPDASPESRDEATTAAQLDAGKIARAKQWLAHHDRQGGANGQVVVFAEALRGLIEIVGRAYHERDASEVMRKLADDAHDWTRADLRSVREELNDLHQHQVDYAKLLSQANGEPTITIRGAIGKLSDALKSARDDLATLKG